MISKDTVTTTLSLTIAASRFGNQNDRGKQRQLSAVIPLTPELTVIRKEDFAELRMPGIFSQEFCHALMLTRY